MKPEEIKRSIYRQGFTLGMLAEVLQKSPNLISKVIHGKARSVAVAQSVSKVLGLTLNDVFPCQYDSYHERGYTGSPAYKTKQEELRELLMEDSKV